ncbi:hypothetical protein CS022_24070 [Veronia nyctiphanis]|uniref:Uncharacterized protein n=1 Tax=Veronia nyctiphanis TaxID=1278244 RepID=A0A4Q0YDY1_9GAMM|nr:hypothetical protein [Veronia nyctiphanis]RXJ68706.1 hypothetical protein CS022_24070 [Veronia nyctiphanis]
MPAIRFKNTLGTVNVWCPTGHLDRTSRVDPIPALLKDGSLVYFNFGGFIERKHLRYEQRVKMINIIGFSANDNEKGPWEAVSDQKLLGIYKERRFYLVLDKGKVVGL